MTHFNYEISKTWECGFDSTYDIAAGDGLLKASYGRDRNYYIQWLEVNKPRCGIGKLLLGAALAHAQDLEAFEVQSVVRSRECLESMLSVFGADALSIDDRGNYGEDPTEYLSDRSTPLAQLSDKMS